MSAIPRSRSIPMRDSSGGTPTVSGYSILHERFIGSSATGPAGTDTRKIAEPAAAGPSDAPRRFFIRQRHRCGRSPTKTSQPPVPTPTSEWSMPFSTGRRKKRYQADYWRRADHQYRGSVVQARVFGAPRKSAWVGGNSRGGFAAITSSSPQHFRTLDRTGDLSISSQADVSWRSACSTSCRNFGPSRSCCDRLW